MPCALIQRAFEALPATSGAAPRQATPELVPVPKPRYSNRPWSTSIRPPICSTNERPSLAMPSGPRSAVSQLEIRTGVCAVPATVVVPREMIVANPDGSLGSRTSGVRASITSVAPTGTSRWAPSSSAPGTSGTSENAAGAILRSSARVYGVARGASARVGSPAGAPVFVPAGASSCGAVSLLASRVAAALRSSCASATLSGACGSDGCCRAVEVGAGSGAL